MARQQRCPEALPLLNRALSSDMRNPDLYTRIANCQVNLGNWPEAEDYLRQATMLFPRLPDGYAGLAVIDLHRDDLAEAESHMRQALQLRLPGSALYFGYHQQLGQILEREGNAAAALREYQAELSENPASEQAQDLAQSLEQRMAAPASAH